MEANNFSPAVLGKAAGCFSWCMPDFFKIVVDRQAQAFQGAANVPWSCLVI